MVYGVYISLKIYYFFKVSTFIFKMACVELPSANDDYEMEEGEIVDDADALSDISSEEEFLLRQRLKVLENYNNALERKEAKRTSIGSGKDHRRRKVLCDLAEISYANGENGFTIKIPNDKKYLKAYDKSKRLRPSKRQVGKNREYKKKNWKKKKLSCKNDSDSTSDDEYISKRHKLANAVSFDKEKNDTTTLKDRLTKMLSGNQTDSLATIQCQTSEVANEVEHNKPETFIESTKLRVVEESSLNPVELELTDSITRDEITISNICVTEETVNSSSLRKEEAPNNSYGTSDEDLEMLRQHALKTKSGKGKTEDLKQKINPENKTETLSEDEDSDTTELRMICLKSALLKKAIEMKRKQKLQKRLSQSSNIHNIDIPNENDNIDNNTDIESVDMEIGSDGDDKETIYITECTQLETRISCLESKDDNKGLNKEDEIEDDEDLLRAKLLTSLSKNMPNLTDLEVLDVPSLNETQMDTQIKSNEIKLQKPPINIEKKKFIIQLGDSDSEAEDEATKNLTKMHIKLSEQAEFQQKLDLFLKSTRMEVEKTKLPDIVQAPASKPNEKLPVKAMNHLPKSEQVEYKNLLKRVAELEKIKQARQISLTLPTAKDTLKPRNVSLESYKLVATKKLEEKIALSRKRIAEESAKMLKLKEEGTKLSQRYKIVATELRNIGTAIALNKKQQRTVQNGLSKIRHQHQILLKSSPINYSSRNMQFGQSNKVMTTNKLQKENDPLKKEEYKNSNNLKAVKVSVVNDLNVNSQTPKLSIEVDLNSNKKTIKLPKSPVKDRVVDFKTTSSKKLNDESLNEKTENERLEKISERIHFQDRLLEDSNDYKSPLDALQGKSWEEDPNGVLCPFEFSGSCRDAECKYIHPKIPK